MSKTSKGAVARAAAPQLPANWEQQMRADAAGYKEAEANVGLGQFMSTQGGVLQFQGTPVPGNKMQGVVLDAILVNAMYIGKYDRQNPQPPVCYAFGRLEKELAPHAEAPQPQNEDCASCPKNKFNSADEGRGKACKNGRRLAIMHVDSLRDVGGIKDAPVAFLNVPPTSLGSWASYVNTLEQTTGRPPYGVVTEIAVVPDPKNQFKVTFTLVDKISDKGRMAAVFAKHAEAKANIAFAFPKAEEGTTAAAGGKRKKPAAPKETKPAAPREVKREPAAAAAGGGRAKF